LNTYYLQTLLTPEFRNRLAVRILPFPYHNYIPIALHRPLFAPVLQSFQGATEALQEFYVDAFERQRPAGLDVVYSLDSVAVWPTDGIRGPSRSSAIGVRFVDDRSDELALNVISDTGDQNSVLVPRFVMYGGWSTSLILANRKNDSATGIVKIYSASGRPMPITLNGVTSSEFRYSVPPSQTFVFSPTALR